MYLNSIDSFWKKDNDTIWKITKKELDLLVCDNEFESVEYTPEVVNLLVSDWWSDKDIRAKNGRGVKFNVILDIVQPAIQQALDETPQTQNMALILTVKDGKIHAQIKNSFQMDELWIKFMIKVLSLLDLIVLMKYVGDHSMLAIVPSEI